MNFQKRRRILYISTTSWKLLLKCGNLEFVFSPTLLKIVGYKIQVILLHILVLFLLVLACKQPLGDWYIHESICKLVLRKMSINQFGLQFSKDSIPLPTLCFFLTSQLKGWFTSMNDELKLKIFTCCKWFNIQIHKQTKQLK
jgi:hypothetical protein